jgi:methyl-accepting chemotaxis protein
MIGSVVIAIILSGVVCIALIFVFSIAAISRPLGKISRMAERIRMGDLGITSNSDISIDVRSSDEIGIMAKSLESAFAELRGYIGEIRERMHGLAGGDLVTKSGYEFRGDFILIKDSINDIVRDLNNIIHNFSRSAAQVSTTSTQMADGARLLAEGSAIQASSVDELSETVGDILNETVQNASVAKEATDLSGAIRGAAERGSAQMDRMVLAIREINEASSKINKVIKVIDDIAFQTNILALNAAVEAARAGQHGKGFSVVADEVRELAAKSAIAANDTAKLIADSVEKANFGLRIVRETEESLQEIVEGINRSAEIISQISRSSDEQAGAIAHVNEGIDKVASIVRQNSATAEQSAAASGEMNEQSMLLRQMVLHFKVDDSGE